MCPHLQSTGVVDDDNRLTVNTGDLTLNNPPADFREASLTGSTVIIDSNKEKEQSVSLLFFFLKMCSFKLTRWFANTAGSFFSNKSNCCIWSGQFRSGISAHLTYLLNTKCVICRVGSLYQTQTTKQSKEFAKCCLKSQPARREWSVEPDLLEELTPGYLHCC